MLILTIIVNPYPKYVGWIYEFFLANIPIKSYILVLLQAFPLLLQMIQIQALLLVEASSPPPLSPSPILPFPLSMSVSAY